MISRSLLLLAFGIACAFLSAPLTPPLSAQTSFGAPQEHDVTGTVIDRVTHQPIGRALVKINGGLATFTDREGRFKFAGVKEPFLTVTAEKPGYVSSQSSWQHSSPAFLIIQQPITSTPRQPDTIELTPEAILFGTVADSGGIPLPSVQLTLYQSAIQNGMKRWQQRLGATSNVDGEFRFANLTAGDYYLTSNFHIESYFGTDVREGYLPTRYPEGLDAITLSAGQQKPINLSLRQGKFYTVTGSLNGNKAGLGVNFSVLTLSGEEIQPPRISTRGAGTFGILLPDGSYQIKATVGGGPQSLIASTSVSVSGRAVTSVPLNFSPQAILRIEIERESVATNNDPADPASVPLPSLHLVSLDPSAYVPPEYYSYAQSVDGTARGPLAFSGVAPGRYLFAGDQGEPWHIISATCGSTDLTREPLIVASGAAGCTLHVVFSDASASLALSARKDGKPVEAIVYLIPVPNLTANLPMRSTAADGPSTSNLPAGRYDALAFDKPQQLEYRNPEVMQRYAQYIRSITLAAGQNATLQIDVVPSEK